MTTLASRIQERANQFISEQAKLQSLQDELLLAVSVELEETERTKEIHRTLLEVSHYRFDMERKICDLNEEIEECNRANTYRRIEAQRLEESGLKSSRKMEEEIKKAYAPHDTSIALYCQALDSAIVRRKRKLSSYQKQDENIRARILLLQHEKEQFCKETLQLEAEINQLKAHETQKDMAITSLAKQVQESLSKVCRSSAIQYPFRPPVASHTISTASLVTAILESIARR